MRTILSTVGTSVVSNAKRQNAPATLEGLCTFLARTDPAEASAETHALLRLQTAPEDRLVFIHSATEEGGLAAAALTAHYARVVNETAKVEVADLTYRASEFARRGLRRLVQVLADLIRKERRDRREVLINATGGFKPETAYATLVGLLFSVPVYYVYETFKEIVVMPAAPIAWDYGLFSLHDEFFEWIEAEPRPSGDVRDRLKALPLALRILVDEPVDGRQYLSPAGVAYFEAYRERLDASTGAPVELDPSAQRDMASADPTTRGRYERLLQKLAIREFWIAHSELVGSEDLRIYPRSDSNERVFFREGENGGVRVVRLTRHSDGTYDRARQDLKQWKGKPGMPW